MKKRVLFYLTAIITTLSLQSCVTNYVASKPIIYKTDANLQSLENSKEKFSLSDVEKLKASSIELNSIKNNEVITTAINHTRKIDEILTEASSYLGTPYRYGGMTRRGIDCSAFVLSVFGATTGIYLPRVASAQSHEGEKIEKSDLQKGDLLFFSHGRGRISHVAIVQEITQEGEVKFIHASTSKGVMISSLNDSYWAPKYRFAKRIIKNETNE